MKIKSLNSLRQNIIDKNSIMNNKENIILTNLYPNSLQVNYQNKSNKNDELLIKKKLFNYNKNINYFTLGSSYHSNLKSIKKNKITINNIYNKQIDNSINKTKNNYILSNSIDNSNNNTNNSKELINLSKNDNIQLNYLLNTKFFNTKYKKQMNLSLDKIKINKNDFAIFSNPLNKINKNRVYKNKEHSITCLNSRKNSNEKKNFLMEINSNNNNNMINNANKIFKDELYNQNYRKYFFNKFKEFSNFDKNEKEIMEIINDKKINNKGLYYLYNYNNIISKQNNKKEAAKKYTSFNSYKGINNTNIYNISNENKTLNKPMMVLTPSNNNINLIQKKENKNKEYNSLLEKKEFNINDIFYDKSNSIFNKNKKINNFNYSDKKNVNHIQIISKNNTIKNWANNNISNINLKNINNMTKKLYNIKEKLKLKKPIPNNKTTLLLNNENDFSNYNSIIQKYFTHSNSSKERKISKEDKINVNNNNNSLIKENDIMIKKQINKDSNMSKKESKGIFNFMKKSKTTEKSEIILDNISEISKESTKIKDSKYYMEKSQKLVNYIKEYFKKYKIYPETKINFYLYGRKIGQGAFGKVNLGLNVLTGRVVAIKSFKKRTEEKFKTNMKKILYETNLMKKLNHPNITKILEVFHDEGYMLIIMEYINGGNLFSFVKKRRKLSEKIAKFLFRQIILGIKYIHSQNIVHRDIKLENIIIDLNNHIKICDFGIGKILKSSEELLYDKCGTPMYMAPEIILSNKKNGYKGFPVDIWASGITLYIMLTGSLPFKINNKNKDELSLNKIKNKDNSNLQFQIINFNLKKISFISDEANNLLKGLLLKNPEKRLTCDEILNHPWLKIINDNSDNNKYHLFTKAEMTIMSKTYIDYRKGSLEDLRENFTITNLINENININEKNITTKSSILDPFNSAINNNSSICSFIKDEVFDDFNNSKIKLENDLIIFNNKVKEYNTNYEINNNQEVDNGMLIKTKSDISLNFSGNTNSCFSKSKENENLFEEQNNEEKINNNKINEYNNEIEENTNLNLIDINNPRINELLNEIETFGYIKEFVIKCLKENILCHASTVYYLLKNYGNIE